MSELSETKFYDICVFHFPCQDGLTSAWVAANYHTTHGRTLELYPMSHGNVIDLERLRGKSVLFCDYSPKRDILETIEPIVTRIQILDHHVSAEAQIADKPYTIFDMKLSGAGLTWNYYHPDEPMPLFIQMIQDRDLWTWKVENSKYFNTGFYTKCSVHYYDFPKLFELYEDVYANPTKVEVYNELGKVIDEAQMAKAQSIALNSIKRVDVWKSIKVCIVNCSTELQSEVGNILSSTDEVDFAVLWRYNHPTEDYYISMRSTGKVDVSQIATSFGGGGHKNAAGFSSKINPVQIFGTPAPVSATCCSSTNM